MNKIHPIAIVGIGGIFPGSPDLDSFWENVLKGISVSRQVPEERWLLSAAEAYRPEKGLTDQVYSKHGCYIENFSPDATLKNLHINPSLLEELDPLFHLLLYAGSQASATLS